MFCYGMVCYVMLCMYVWMCVCVCVCVALTCCWFCTGALHPAIFRRCGDSVYPRGLISVVACTLNPKQEREGGDRSDWIASSKITSLANQFHGQWTLHVHSMNGKKVDRPAVLQDKHTSLTASWPFWDGCPIWLEKAIKWYYTIAQFQATDWDFPGILFWPMTYYCRLLHWKCDDCSAKGNSGLLPVKTTEISFWR